MGRCLSHYNSGPSHYLYEVIFLKKKFVLTGMISGILLLGGAVYYQFFDYEKFTLIQDSELKDNKGNIYYFNGGADQTTTKLKSRAIGETQNGDLVFQLEGDSSKKELIVIPNTEMPPWIIYQKQKRKIDTAVDPSLRHKSPN